MRDTKKQEVITTTNNNNTISRTSKFMKNSNNYNEKNA